jgi:hypothetical protein
VYTYWRPLFSDAPTSFLLEQTTINANTQLPYYATQPNREGSESSELSKDRFWAQSAGCTITMEGFPGNKAPGLLLDRLEAAKISRQELIGARTAGGLK